MIELRDGTLDTVHLAVLEGGEAVYIAKEDGLHPVASDVSRSSPLALRIKSEPRQSAAGVRRRPGSAASPELGGLTRYTPLTHVEADDFHQEDGPYSGTGLRHQHGRVAS